MRITVTMVLLIALAAAGTRAQPSVLAVTGATVIDGNGGQFVVDCTAGTSRLSYTCTLRSTR